MPTLAIIGATGRVGSEFIDVLHESTKEAVEVRQYFDDVRCFASKKSAGTTLSVMGKSLEVEALEDASFEGIDVAMIAAGGAISEIYTPKLVAAGAVVVDNSSHYRYDERVPLVVPEVNGDDVLSHQGIIANPNCSTAQLVLPLHAIQKGVGLIERLIVSTYQSASGAGKVGEDKLWQEIHEAIASESKNGEDQDSAEQLVSPDPGPPHHRQLAFNVVPHIDKFLENGYTKEEMKIVWETQKILHTNDMEISATAVRVPVVRGHSESVTVDLKGSATVDKLRAAIESMPSCRVCDDVFVTPPVYPTPIDAAHNNLTWVGRIRQDTSRPKTFHFWVVSDNLRKGAAFNALQIIHRLLDTF